MLTDFSCLRMASSGSSCSRVKASFLLNTTAEEEDDAARAAQ